MDRSILPLGLLVALCFVACSASAKVVTFDFTSLPGGTPASQVTRVFTIGTLELTVTAFGQDEDAEPNPTETEAVSYVAGRGLGVRDITDILVSDIDAVDGNRGNEELILTFNRPVTFLSAVFEDWSNQAFADEIFFLLNDGDFGDFATPGNRIAFFNADANGGTGNPQWQALPNYTFPGAQAGPKTRIKLYVQDADSGILFSSLTVDAVVPAPGGLPFLLAGALGAAAFRRRRNSTG